MGRVTARLFDAMAEDYDVLEPWYEHLYAVLHGIVLEALAPRDAHRPRALDAGCGSGFQTALLERLGYEAHGVDVAPRLLAVAQRRLPASTFALASVEALPYRDASFEAVACCGSTLSFVDDAGTALGELARVLEPGGRLLLEVEHRWSLDLVWTLVSALGGDCLGYGVSPREAWRALVRRPRDGCTVTYPAYGPLRLFTRRELRTLLRGAGLHPVRWWGIHTVTNLIPSTILHGERLGSRTTTIYRKLCRLDARWSASSLAARTANSLVVLAEKR
ncbi:MAG TPA: class I SAM-dependent methyltransferase [Candidatus Acidoferrum sp.]|nr:class I SAM-dependent methyltransferase [Candidatus Acidoferrum sp.]